jgi:hypothetical protein
MKHVKLFEDFINEKAYQLTGSFGAKGVAGKVLFAFKKEVERIKFEGDVEKCLEEINKVWSKWADKDGAEIVEREVMKLVKDTEGVVYITVTLAGTQWEADEVNGVNAPGKSELLVRIPSDFTINIGFADDVDSGKYARRLGGMQNNALITGKESTIYGSYDSLVGRNNIEIRSGLFLTIDAK